MRVLLGVLSLFEDDVAKFIAEGGDVFAVHVVKVDDAVRAKDEVVVVDGDNAGFGGWAGFVVGFGDAGFQDWRGCES